MKHNKRNMREGDVESTKSDEAREIECRHEREKEKGVEKIIFQTTNIITISSIATKYTSNSYSMPSM